MAANDDDPGRVRHGANIDNATFGSFLAYSSAYFSATEAERSAVHKAIPISRGDGDEPGVSGYFSSDRTYSAGGQALNRQSVRS